MGVRSEFVFKYPVNLTDEDNLIVARQARRDLARHEGRYANPYHWRGSPVAHSEYHYWFVCAFIDDMNLVRQDEEHVEP
jgi:hypothetical protein